MEDASTKRPFFCLFCAFFSSQICGSAGKTAVFCRKTTKLQAKERFFCSFAKNLSKKENFNKKRLTGLDFCNILDRLCTMRMSMRIRARGQKG